MIPLQFFQAVIQVDIALLVYVVVQAKVLDAAPGEKPERALAVLAIGGIFSSLVASLYALKEGPGEFTGQLAAGGLLWALSLVFGQLMATYVLRGLTGWRLRVAAGASALAVAVGCLPLLFG